MEIACKEVRNPSGGATEHRIMDFSDRAMCGAACMTLCPSVYSNLCANVKRNEFPARACLFYGIYDYPVIDYYFETICRVETSRLRGFVLRGEIFPFVEDEYRDSRVGYHIFYVAGYTG